MLFYLVVDQTFLCLHSKNISYKKNLFLKLKSFIILKDILIALTVQVNNLDDMEREQYFYRHKAFYRIQTGIFINSIFVYL